jgi:hypothetical protein
MSYKNGIDINTTSSSIVIPRKALYFVYVAITFDFGDITSIPIFYHNVTKSHPLLPRTIATLLMSKYGGSTESERVYTSFLCGTFQMQGNFNIKTEVSSYDYVSKSKYASYFGMFRIWIERLLFCGKNIISTGCGFRELFMFCGMLLTKRNIIFLFRLAKS